MTQTMNDNDEMVELSPEPVEGQGGDSQGAITPAFDPATITPEMRAMIARDWASQNPQEFVPASMLEQRQTQQSAPVQSAPARMPKWDEFDTADEYFRARESWEESRMSQAAPADGNAIAQQVLGALAPYLAPVMAQTAAASFPAEVQDHVQQVLSENPAWAGQVQDPAVRRAVEDMAYGRMYRSGGAPQSRGGVPTSRTGITGPVRIPVSVNNAINTHDQWMQRQGMPPMTQQQKIEMYHEMSNEGVV